MRSSTGLAVFLAVMISGVVATASAQPWRYVDKRGHVNYTNNINQLPPKLRKKVRAAIERKQARLAAERAAAEAAAPASAAVVSVPSIAIPAPATAQSVASKPEGPTPHDKWREKLAAADKQVADLGIALADAQRVAQTARRKALITPTGFTSADWKRADAKVKSLNARLNTAEAARARLRKAEPPTRRRRR